MAAKGALLVRCDCPTLLGACQAAPAVLCTVLVPTFQDVVSLTRVQRRTKKMIKWQENLSHEKILKELGLFALKKMWLEGTSSQYSST